LLINECSYPIMMHEEIDNRPVSVIRSLTACSLQKRHIHRGRLPRARLRLLLSR
jgi:hypothetical protein